MDLDDILSQDAAHHEYNSTFSEFSKGNDTNTTNAKGIKWTENVYIPFALCGVMALINALGYILAYKLKSKYQNKEDRNRTDKKDNSQCTLVNKIAMSSGLIIMYTSLMTSIFGLEYFLFSVAVFSRLNFSKEEAVSLVTVFLICLTIGRFGSALLLRCISIKLFCNVMVVSATVTGIFLSVFGLGNHVTLWVLVSLFIYLLSPLYAAGYV